MDTSPLLPRTNIPIAVKQLFGKAIGNVTLVFVLLPHCLIEVQWGTFNFNQTIWVDYNSSWSKTINFPISFNHVLWVYPSSPPKSFLEQAYYTNSGLYLFHSPSRDFEVINY